MKIEAGKYYRTRDGNKVRVFSLKGGESYPVRGVVWDEEQGEWVRITWTSEGRFWLGREDDLDLVAEWREPVKVE